MVLCDSVMNKVDKSHCKTNTGVNILMHDLLRLCKLCKAKRHLFFYSWFNHLQWIKLLLLWPEPFIIKQINFDILNTQQNVYTTKRLITLLKILIDPQAIQKTGCDPLLALKVQAAQNAVIARRLQCNKRLIGLCLRCNIEHHVWHSAQWCHFAGSLKRSEVRKETRLQLRCELFTWTRSIINQPLQYWGHGEVIVITKVSKEA